MQNLIKRRTRIHTTHREGERERSAAGMTEGAGDSKGGTEKERERERERTSVLRLASLRLPLPLLPLQFYI